MAIVWLIWNQTKNIKLMVWYCMACIYFRLTGFIVQPMNLVTLGRRMQIQLLPTMQPLALGGALVPKGQNISCLTIEPNLAEKFYCMSIRLSSWTTGPEKITFPHLKCQWASWSTTQAIVMWVRKLSHEFCCGCKSLEVATEMSSTTTPRVDWISILFICG